MAVVVERLPVAPDPVALFAVLGGPERSYSALLDSALACSWLGRYSFVLPEPFLVLRGRGRDLTVLTEEGVTNLRGDPFEALRELLQQYRRPRTEAPFPFRGGAVGYFAYDLGRQIEALPVRARDDLALPEMHLGFHDLVVAVDHLKKEVYACSSGLSAGAAGNTRRAARRLAALRKRLERGGDPAPDLPEGAMWRQIPGRTGVPAGQPNRKPEETAPPPVRPVLEDEGDLTRLGLGFHFTRATYCAAVERAREYIAAGDIFEVNLSQRLEAPLSAPPWHLYRILRAVNPAPFAAYLNFPEAAVVCASPERFLRLHNGMVETRPIKGTRPRGRTPEEDRRLREELWRSEKDRAELTMIIDLERNDLGRVCAVGSVHVPELFCLEEYATVFHLVSTVRGRLAPGKDVVDLLRATFPGGSITGAPKIRAMEIIEELEPVRRGIYTGSIGWIGFDGDCDLNIVIRTIIVKEGTAYFQVGGAVTADSVPEQEYLETLDKARALITAVLLANAEHPAATAAPTPVARVPTG
ncbi:MAG: aminodeoxychorismate synthase component I [Desulfotomaculales bacterium]